MTARIPLLILDYVMVNNGTQQIATLWVISYLRLPPQELWNSLL
ncbi:hypothetical protein [uncultured Paraglaciecola sp.]